jgi:hypothetical protein
LRKLPCDREVRGYYKCKELPVILDNRIVDTKKNIVKMEGQERGNAQGVADPQKVMLTMA